MFGSAALRRLDDTADRILDLLFARWNPLPGNLVDLAASREPHRRKLEALVVAGRPIELVLPAFPAKSPNPEKTLGALPDFGEVLALRELEELCRAVDALHAPGAKLTICSDGRVFGDLVRVTDTEVDAYGAAIDGIIADYEFSHLRTYGLEHAFPTLSGDRMREALVRDSARPIAEVRERVKGREDYRAMFNGIHRFLFEDQIALDHDRSRNQVRERTKTLAYEVIQRSNAWSELVERCFPDALRLSIHPQPAISTKIGVRLLPSDDIWRTPWHSVALRDETGYRLVRRKDAEARGARLVSADRGHRYYTLAVGEA